MTQPQPPSNDSGVTISLDLRFAILIVGTINVVAAGVGQLADAVGFQPEKWMLAIAFLISLGTAFILAQLDSWHRG